MKFPSKHLRTEKLRLPGFHGLKGPVSSDPNYHSQDSESLGVVLPKAGAARAHSCRAGLASRAGARWHPEPEEGRGELDFGAPEPALLAWACVRGCRARQRCWPERSPRASYLDAPAGLAGARDLQVRPARSLLSWGAASLLGLHLPVRPDLCWEQEARREAGERGKTSGELAEPRRGARCG